MGKFASIIVKYLSGFITENERKELEERLKKSEAERKLFEEIVHEKFSSDHYRQYASVDVEKAIREFDRRTKERSIRRIACWGMTAAAVVGLAVGSWHYYYGDRQKDQAVMPVAQTIVAGSSQALLTLSSGEVVDLMSEKVEKLDTQLMNNVKGRLTYRKQEEEKPVYNMLQVPLGGEYELELSDGTVICLNSGTKIRYPVSFGSGERSVELLEGEAYFSVAKSSMPFHVKIDGMHIRVYGTEFNVNTYTPDHVYTTLVKGKVGILYRGGRREVILTPNTQADYDRTVYSVAVREVDPQLYVAWKNGKYVFRNETLYTILRTLGMWYNFKVVFMDEDLKNLHFSGHMTRYDEINKITDAIAYSVGIRIDVKGNTLYVSH